MPESYIYETRLVLFLDILGFREIVDRTTRDKSYLIKVIRALDRIGEMVDEPDLKRSSVVSQFSDSIVISYKVSERSGVFDLLTKIAFCVVDLVGYGFLVRGAVTIGELFHDNRRLIGPAMVRAYEIESQEANYPRIVVDPDVFQIARRYRSDIHDPDDEEEYVRAYLVEDDDGCLYYPYISWESVVNVTGLDNDAYGEYLFRLSQIIGPGLEHPSNGVRNKYLWLHQQYVSAIRKIEELPENHAYRRENFEMCQAIAALPKFIKEAGKSATTK